MLLYAQIKLHVKSETTQHNEYGQETNNVNRLDALDAMWRSQLRDQNLKAYTQNWQKKTDATKAGGLSRAPDTHWLSWQYTVSLVCRSLKPSQSCQTCPGWTCLPLRLKTAVPTIITQDRTATASYKCYISLKASDLSSLARCSGDRECVQRLLGNTHRVLEVKPSEWRGQPV